MDLSISQLSRFLAFGRHLPSKKLLRRIKLSLRRRLRDRLGSRVEKGLPPFRSGHPLQPIFLPRTGRASRTDGTFAFKFLGRTISMPDATIEWSLPGPGARNQLWRMNIHYMEYLEEMPDADFVELIDQWIEANPKDQPGAWRDSWNSYSLSLRVTIWMQQLALRNIALSVTERMTSSLTDQIRFLAKNLETDIGGNHLIKNIKALIWSSSFFEGAEAEEWRQLGVELLAKELRCQILSDGMQYERSPSYHCQVFADLLECHYALGADPFSAELEATLHRMAQVTADTAHPDGKIALLNDAGLTMAYEPAECLNVYEQQFGRSVIARKVFTLEDAGYYGARVEGNYFIADCGRIAPDDLPAHGHGDVLSFEWSIKGERIIVDQGVYEYAEGSLRQRARMAASHNTLCFNNADQADFFGSFRCGRRPNVSVLDFKTIRDGFILEGKHDGFRYLKGSPLHVRRFEICSRGLSIRDRIEGSPRCDSSICFLLAPGVEVETINCQTVIRKSGVVMRATCSLPIWVEDAVWWPDMGNEFRTKRLRILVPSEIKNVETSFEILSDDNPSSLCSATELS